MNTAKRMPNWKIKTVEGGTCGRRGLSTQYTLEGIAGIGHKA